MRKFKRGDKVRYIGEPINLSFGAKYTFDMYVKGRDYLKVEESSISFPSGDFELVDSSPENPAKENLSVKKVDEIHITIGETTHHLTREEARELEKKLSEAIWS